MSTSSEQGENPQTIGSILQQARIRNGHDISTMAHLLRIRQPYLEAIEQGRYDLLPGPAYASGFVRSYAEQLGLNGDQFVQRFREETSTEPRAVELQFPSPVTESSKPSASMIAVGLVVLLVGYGAWSFYNRPTMSVSEWIPPIPDQLASWLPADTSEIEAGSGSDDVAGTSSMAAIDRPASPPLETPDNVSDEPQADAAPAGSADRSADSTATPQQPEAAAEGSPGSAFVSLDSPIDDRDVSDTSIPEITGSSPDPAAVADGRDAEPDPDTDGPASDSVVASAQPTDGASPAAGAGSARVFGDAADARIVLRATQDSWIEVRDPTGGDLLVARLMRPGDVYLVPNRDGLTLLTGNAGGLDIFIDGDLAPTLGKPGVVRKNVALDANALQSQ